jgi:hypothetical protein
MVKKSIRKGQIRRFSTKNNIIGGTVYGSGSFGVVTGDPPAPNKHNEMPPTNKSKRTLGKTRNLSRKTLKNNDKYVSKLFFNESNINDVLNTVNLLTEVCSGKDYKKIFGPYLVLPHEFTKHKLVTEIDTAEYLGPVFQSDKYWSKMNGVVDNESRTKLQQATKQVWYPKATGGDLGHLQINNYTEFVNCLHYFKNIVKGVQVLHNKKIVHHDLKPLNILIQKNNKNTPYYKISDLDTLKKLDDFTIDNIEKQHVDRLLTTWGYEYFPTCITLLISILKSRDNTIKSDDSNYVIRDGFKVKFNVDSGKRVGKDTEALVARFKNILPSSQYGIPTITDINRNKYGVTKINDYELTDASGNISNGKFTLLTQLNGQIARLLNNPEANLSLIDKRNILLKYVDIYSIGRSLLELLNNYITNSTEVFDDKMKQHIESIMDFLYYTLTYTYFEDQYYSKDILELYEQQVLQGKPRTSVSSISNNSGVVPTVFD